VTANVSVNSGAHEMKRKKRAFESSPSDCEECEEPTLIETDGENIDSVVECVYCSGPYSGDCRSEKGINCKKNKKTTSGAMGSVQVQTTAKYLFAFYATLKNCACLP
jgi:hypothetical protein